MAATERQTNMTFRITQSRRFILWTLQQPKNFSIKAIVSHTYWQIRPIIPSEGSIDIFRRRRRRRQPKLA